jgi:uncharacterized protein (TIGR03435 family)
MAMKGSCRRTGFGRGISLAVATGFLLTAPTAIVAQATDPVTNNDSKPLTFEVVSIREDKSESISQVAMQSGPTSDGLRLRGVQVFGLLQMAYLPSSGGMAFRPNRIIGVPAWAFYTGGVRYDIDAKVSEADLPRWKDLAQRPTMLRAMLQAMLADRFKLTAHRETREIPVYEVTVGSKARS